MEWISVENRLPEYVAHAGADEFVHVIACTSSGMVGEAMYCNGKWEFMSVDATFYISHWMPLPEPPEIQ